MASDRSVREKLAIASAETYKMLRADMSEIITTSDWKRARGVGFTDVRTFGVVTTCFIAHPELIPIYGN